MFLLTTGIVLAHVFLITAILYTLSKCKRNSKCRDMFKKIRDFTVVTTVVSIPLIFQYPSLILTMGLIDIWIASAAVDVYLRSRLS